jgi:hypothetical protein
MDWVGGRGKSLEASVQYIPEIWQHEWPVPTNKKKQPIEKITTATAGPFGRNTTNVVCYQGFTLSIDKIHVHNAPPNHIHPSTKFGDVESSCDDEITTPASLFVFPKKKWGIFPRLTYIFRAHRRRQIVPYHRATTH